MSRVEKIGGGKIDEEIREGGKEGLHIISKNEKHVK